MEKVIIFFENGYLEKVIILVLHMYQQHIMLNSISGVMKGDVYATLLLPPIFPLLKKGWCNE